MNETIPKENQSKTARTRFRLLFAGGLLCLITLVAWFSYLKVRVSRVDRAFAAIELGDSSKKVVQQLGMPDQVKQGNEVGWLSLLPEDKQNQCTKQYSYTVDTPFIPITWLAYFDHRDRVIMTTRLD